jgi:hypothetical protein
VSAEFHVSLTRVNWLMDIVVLVYLPVAALTPVLVQRWNLRRVVGNAGMGVTNQLLIGQ